MTFASFPPGVVFAGLAALAGILWLLQRLRVRHREVPVVTTLFWREAIEEARARVLFQRFRHPLAYLLVVLIASLLWLALSDPRSAGGDREDVVLLLDGSAGMTRSGRFDAAVRALGEEAARTDPARRTAILCGASPVTLLSPGEDALLLPRRLRGAGPEACPATLTGTIRALAGAAGGKPLRIRVFGDAAIRSDRLALLPENVTVERATSPPQAGSNRGIVALGVSEAASGAWDKVDVLVTVGGLADGSAPDLVGTLDGRPLPDSGTWTVRERGVADLLLRDLPARGGLLEVRLPTEDSTATDDAAGVRLPDRPPIRVALRGEVPEAIRAVLAADPAVRIVESRPDVVVGDAATDAPGLVLDPAPPDGHAILLRDPSGRDPADVLAEALADLALDEIDAMEIAARAGRPVSVGVEAGERREVRLATDLLGADFDFTGQRAFPVFVGRTIRWLAGVRDFPAVVAVGRSVPGRTEAFRDGASVLLDPAGEAFVPPVAGTYVAVSGPGIVAALLDPTLVGADADSLPPGGSAPDGGGPVDALTVLGLVAFALLVFEWFLHRTGRMP